MAVEVKKGGKKDYTCAAECGVVIGKGEKHFRTGGKGGFKRYHEACLPVKKNKTDKETAKPETTKTTEKK